MLLAVSGLLAGRLLAQDTGGGSPAVAVVAAMPGTGIAPVVPPKGNPVDAATAREKLRDNLDAQVAEFLKFHNDARAEVGAPPLIWDSQLAVYAQEWADELGTSGIMKHRDQDQYGENIAGYFPVDGSRPVHGAKLWYDEKAKYHGEKMDEQNFQAFGHYTQVVWQKTQRVGFGIAMTKNGLVMLVANYAPPGNMLGERPSGAEMP